MFPTYSKGLEAASMYLSYQILLLTISVIIGLVIGLSVGTNLRKYIDARCYRMMKGK